RAMAAARLLEGEREQPLAGRHAGKIRRLLRGAPAEEDGVGAEEDAREDGLGHEAPAELLHHDHQVEVAEPEAAVLDRQDDAEPAEAAHLLPERTREAVGIAV